MIYGTITANSLNELTVKVQNYARRYHPAGYGTSFYTGVGKERKYYGFGYEPTYADFNIRSAPKNENGEYFVNYSRYESCD